jgi:hypothetical protein
MKSHFLGNLCTRHSYQQATAGSECSAGTSEPRAIHHFRYRSRFLTFFIEIYRYIANVRNSVTQIISAYTFLAFYSTQWHVDPLQAPVQQLLLGNRSADTFPRQRGNTQKWKGCFLCGPCRGYITRTSCHYKISLKRQSEECEMVASLRGSEPGERGMPTVGNLSQAAHWKPWLRTLVFAL